MQTTRAVICFLSTLNAEQITTVVSLVKSIPTWQKGTVPPMLVRFLSTLDGEQLKTATDLMASAACASTVAANEHAPPAPSLKPGDVVYLASGGPAMTIDRITDDGVNVTWWAGVEKGYEECSFQPAALVRNNPLE